MKFKNFSGQIETQWTNANCQKQIIKKSMVLQVLSCVDVGQSAYSQLQNILKVDNENVAVSADAEDPSVAPTQYRQAAWEPKTSRMLKLILTDGFQTIQAIEHEPIHDLKYPMNPGCKLKLKPPITCRRGVMMLIRKNVEFLGGEVEEMRGEFELKKVLAVVIGTENVGPVGNTGDTVSTAAPVHSTPANNIVTTSTTTTETPFNDDNDDFLIQVEDPMAATNNVKSECASRSTQIEPKTSTNTQSQMFQESKPSGDNKTNCNINEKPFTYLNMLPKLTKDWGMECYTVKACVISLVDKLSMVQDDLTEKYQWKLGVVITDGTDNCIVQLSATLIESLIGFSPDKYKNFNANDKKRNEKCLMDVSQKLIELNSLLKLQSINDEITVIDVITLNKGHLQQLKNRCKDSE